MTSIPEFLPYLRCPFCATGVLQLRTGPSGAPHHENATLDCSQCAGTSEVIDGIWHAMGTHRASRSLAQLSNLAAPTARWYEDVWRTRSLSLLSGRSFPNSEELIELTSALGPGPGRFMLDVACSEGLYARALARAGSPVIAVDHSVVFLEKLRTRCEREDLAVLPVRALAQYLPVADNAMAGVAMGGSLNEIGDAAQAVAEMARVLDGNGRFFSMHLLRSHTWKGRAAQLLAGPAGIKFLTLSGTHRLLRDGGLVATMVRTDGVVARITAERSPNVMAERPRR